MALLLDSGVNMLIVHQPIQNYPSWITHQKLWLWSLTLGASCKLSKLCIALRDDLNQILFTTIVNGGILLESFLAWWLCKWLIMKNGWLLKHGLVWGVNFNYFLAIRGNCVLIIKFENSSVRYWLRRSRLCVNCCPWFELVLFFGLPEPKITDGLESRKLSFMPVVTHLGKNIRINLWFFYISILLKHILNIVLLRHCSYLNRV